MTNKKAPLKPDNESTEPEQRLTETFVDESEIKKISTPPQLPMPQLPALRIIAEKIILEPSDMNSLDHWAKQAAMSRRSFTRHFNKETGLSFVLWRQLAKVYAAINELAQGKTVKEVSANLGYKDSSTFIALFRKTFGTSPKKYFYSEPGKSGLAKLSEKKMLIVSGLVYELFDWIAPQIQRFAGDQFSDLINSISFLS